MRKNKNVKIVTETQLDIWCTCKDNDFGGRMIKCERDKKCESYLERLRTANAIGGNWFHIS